MARITAELYIDFETDKVITENQFMAFKKAIKEIIARDWELQVYDTAALCGFEADSVHPVGIRDIDCEFDV